MHLNGEWAMEHAINKKQELIKSGSRRSGGQRSSEKVAGRNIATTGYRVEMF